MKQEPLMVLQDEEVQEPDISTDHSIFLYQYGSVCEKLPDGI